jgi:hypothetical protein
VGIDTILIQPRPPYCNSALDKVTHQKKSFRTVA